jgi:hypothetical protein
MAANAGNPTTPINASEIARLLATPKGFNALYAVNKRKHALIGLFDYIGGQSKALKIDSVNGVISSMKLDNYKTRSFITASNPTIVNGNQLLVAVTDASDFLLNYVVTDKMGNLGVVVNKTSNSITLSAVNAALTTSMFTGGSTAGSYAVQLFNVSATQGSDKPDFIKYLPDVFQNNYLQVTRGSMTLNAAEFNATFIDGVQGAKNYQAAFMQYQVALNNFADGIEARMYNGQAAANVTLAGSQTGNTNGGLDWAIKNRGGIYDTLASFPSTSYILEKLVELRENTGRPNSEFVFICGPSAKFKIANALQQYKITAGKASVLDGAGLAVEGFNTTFGYVSLMDSWYLADKFWNPSISAATTARKQSDEFYIITLDATPDFFGAEAPLVRMCYRDEPGVAGASITTSWVNGLIDKDGMRINNASTANSLDQVTVNWYTNSGIDIVDAAGLYAMKLSS